MCQSSWKSESCENVKLFIENFSFVRARKGFYEYLKNVISRIVWMFFFLTARRENKQSILSDEISSLREIKSRKILARAGNGRIRKSFYAGRVATKVHAGGLFSGSSLHGI